MKKILALLPVLALAGILAIGSGCANTPEGQRVRSAAKVAAYVGTQAYLTEHPAARPAFEDAALSLVLLEEAETIDFAVLLAIVQRLPIKELKSQNAVIVITAVTILLSDYGGSLPLERLEELRPLVKAIREGIELGVAATPPLPSS